MKFCTTEHIAHMTFHNPSTHHRNPSTTPATFAQAPATIAQATATIAQPTLSLALVTARLALAIAFVTMTVTNHYFTNARPCNRHFATNAHKRINFFTHCNPCTSNRNLCTGDRTPCTRNRNHCTSDCNLCSSNRNACTGCCNSSRLPVRQLKSRLIRQLRLPRCVVASPRETYKTSNPYFTLLQKASSAMIPGLKNEINSGQSSFLKMLNPFSSV